MENELLSHVLALPLWIEPSNHFKDFLNDIGSPTKYRFHVRYWNRKIIFFSYSMPKRDGELGRRSASVNCSGNTEALICYFVQMFNSVVNICPDEREIVLELQKVDNSQKTKKSKKAVGPKKITYLLVVTVTPKTASAAKQLSDIFGMPE